MEILNCPFCGQQPKLEIFYGTCRFYCSCEHKPITGTYSTKKNAIEAWNRREQPEDSAHKKLKPISFPHSGKIPKVIHCPTCGTLCQG